MFKSSISPPGLLAREKDGIERQVHRSLERVAFKTTKRKNASALHPFLLPCSDTVLLRGDQFLTDLRKAL